MSGNGTDLGHVTALLQQVLANQVEQGRTLAEHGRTLAGHGRTLAEHGRILAELGRRSEEHDRRLDQQGQLLIVMARKLDDLDSQVKGLRQTVVEYHSAVIGHGVLISEMDDRLRRVEQRLGLSPAA